MSSNNRWWTTEQEVLGSINWERNIREAPWYKCVTRKHIQADELGRLYYTDHGTAQEMLEHICKHYYRMAYSVRMKVASRPGYLPESAFGVAPYLGQWGKGWVIFTHKSPSSVCTTYLILDGGDPHGIADYYQ